MTRRINRGGGPCLFASQGQAEALPQPKSNLKIHYGKALPRGRQRNERWEKCDEKLFEEAYEPRGQLFSQLISQHHAEENAGPRSERPASMQPRSDYRKSGLSTCSSGRKGGGSLSNRLRTSARSAELKTQHAAAKPAAQTVQLP